MQPDAPVIVAALRSPIGTAGRALADVTVEDVAAPVLRAVADAATGLGCPPPLEVVLGNCLGPGGDVARVASLAAGLGESVPALTVDRQCGSGLAAVDVALGVLAREPGLVLAGGAESASTAPWRSWPGGSRYERAPFAPRGWDDPDMGLAADLLAAEHGVSRAAQDRYAARSHERAASHQAAGGFDAEIVRLPGLARDERVRAGLTAERLARLRPTFRPAQDGGTVTAGNACGVNDGAAVVALVDGATHARLGAPGLRVLATATAGVPVARPGLGVVPAVQQVLQRGGVGLDDVDDVEVNEAFAGQVLACCAELGLDPERVCPEGGALALGHPWGASGAVLLVRLFSRLVRAAATPGRLGLAAIAVGGGQGVAVLVESVAA